MEIEYPATCLSTEEEILRSDIKPIKVKKGDMLLIMHAKSVAREADKKIEELIEERLGVKALVLPTGLEIKAVIESGT